MDVTNENQEDTPLLTHGDLAMAAFSLSELFNYYLEQYNAEEYGELDKEQVENMMNNLRTAFIKFNSLLETLNPQEEPNEEGD
jgi:hypothetical protein